MRTVINKVRNRRVVLIRGGSAIASEALRIDRRITQRDIVHWDLFLARSLSRVGCGLIGDVVGIFRLGVVF